MKLITQYSNLRRENYILAFGRLVTGLGSMAWPMLTLILSQKMHVDAQRISWLFSAAMILMAPAVYAGGKLADRFNKKDLIIVLDIFSVICYLVCAFTPLSWRTIILMFLGSVGQNMENPAYNALTADITSTADRDKSYSLQYLCANLGLVLAPTVAGLLFNNYLWLIFLINAVSIFSSAVLILFKVKDISPVVEKVRLASYQEERPGESMLQILKESKTVLLFIAFCCAYYAVYQMYVYLMPLDLAELHGDKGAIIYGSVTSINCIVVVLFTPVITRLSDGRPETDRMLTGYSLLLMGFGIFLAFKGHVPVYYMAMAILTIGEVFAMTADSPYLSRRIPSSHRGRINGVYTLMRTLITSSFQLLTGAVYAAAGSLAAWITVLGVGILFLIIGFSARSADRRRYPDLY
ncbi:MAG: MFS transporter [Clostridiales bacterium]|nr:MFS transporter [Clostridiales bacterium]